MIKITKSHLRDMVLEAASRLLNETTRRQKAQRAINGKYVRTMAILTSENPRGNPYPEGLKTMEFNRGRRDDLEMRLSTGYYSYFKLKGEVLYHLQYPPFRHLIFGATLQSRERNIHTN